MDDRRWRIKPALRPLWRDAATLQFGIAAPHAVVVGGMTAADRALLDLLDGSRATTDVLAAAETNGVSVARVQALLASLSDAGVLEDTAARLRLTEDERQRLEPDLASLSLRHRATVAAVDVLDRRRRAGVSIHGTGRVGASVAGLLAAAGVGRIGCVDTAAVRPADLSPGGITAMADQTRGHAAAERADALSSVSRVEVRMPRDPALAVLTPVASVPAPELVASVRHRPHLLAVVSETTASVGPLVDPGRTPCLRCIAIGRGERDPQWPTLAAQLVSTPAHVEPCDIALATLTAALTAMQTLAWLDGETPSAVGGVLEFDLVEGRLRRRSVAAHPACGCGAAEPVATSSARATR